MIPKTTNAERASEFMPILCWNAMYKVVSKLLAKRLHDLLPTMIQVNQTAFIKQRQIEENVLLTSKLVQQEWHLQTWYAQN